MSIDSLSRRPNNHEAFTHEKSTRKFNRFSPFVRIKFNSRESVGSEMAICPRQAAITAGIASGRSHVKWARIGQRIEWLDLCANAVEWLLPSAFARTMKAIDTNRSILIQEYRENVNAEVDKNVISWIGRRLICSHRRRRCRHWDTFLSNFFLLFIWFEYMNLCKCRITIINK